MSEYSKCKHNLKIIGENPLSYGGTQLTVECKKCGILFKGILFENEFLNNNKHITRKDKLKLKKESSKEISEVKK